jgi:calcium-independent phospholipase A2-gamma
MSATIQQKTNEALKTETEAKPKFIQKRENMQENYSYYSQSSIDSNTRHCVDRLKEATTTISLTTTESIKFRLEEFNVHLNKFPLAAILANKMGAQEIVKNIRGLNSDTLQGHCLETLARLGYQEQLTSSPGIRILSIDGGGMKGVIALEILRKLEKKTGKKIHQLFDYCIGVSTGSIIIGLLALKKMSVDEAAQIYQDIGAQVFEQTYLKAVQGMVSKSF